MIYIITNPSDPYTLSAPDLATAAASTLILGEGNYGLHDERDNPIMPLLIFGGEEAWCAGQFGHGYGELLKRVGWTPIADCLDTVLLGSVSDRRVYEKALTSCRPEEIETVKRAYAELYKPSSANDIGARAKQIAERIRGIAKEFA